MKLTFLMLSFLTLFIGFVSAADFSGVKFLMISTAEQAAVVRNVDGELKLLKAGDMVDVETRIIDFESDHVVLEIPGEWAPERILVEVTKGETQVTRLARRPIEKYQFRGGEVESFKAKTH